MHNKKKKLIFVADTSMFLCNIQRPTLFSPKKGKLFILHQLPNLASQRAKKKRNSFFYRTRACFFVFYKDRHTFPQRKANYLFYINCLFWHHNAQQKKINSFFLQNTSMFLCNLQRPTHFSSKKDKIFWHQLPVSASKCTTKKRSSFF